MSIQRPTPGSTYYAPIHIGSRYPLVFGEEYGLIIDQPTQAVGVVYSTQEAAEEALADLGTWHPDNARHARIARLVHCGTIMQGRSGLAFATQEDADAHQAAHEAAVAAAAARRAA